MKRVVAIVLCVLIVLSTFAILFSSVVHGSGNEMMYYETNAHAFNFTGIIFFVLLIITGSVGFAMYAFKRTKSITNNN